MTWDIWLPNIIHWIWLILLNMISSFIHCPINGLISLWLIKLHYVCLCIQVYMYMHVCTHIYTCMCIHVHILHSFYLFICWWAFKPIPSLSHCFTVPLYLLIFSHPCEGQLQHGAAMDLKFYLVLSRIIQYLSVKA